MTEHAATPEPTRNVLSIADIRSHFPALQRLHRGRPIAYFDAPGGTQAPATVIDAVAGYLSHHNANTHWVYATSVETDAIIATARASVASLLNASPDEIAFGPNMTTLTYHLARAIGRGLSSGDAIVVTDLDHHANIDPWRALAVERGVEIRRVPFDPLTSALTRDALERIITPGVRLVAIGGASNAIGTINDVAAVVQLAHAAGAWVFVDAVHWLPHALVDVTGLDCDLLACSGYKFYGPHIGILYGKRDVLRGLDVPKLEPAPSGPAERFELGTQNHEGIAGIAATVKYVTSLAPGLEGRSALAAAYDAIHARCSRLFQRLWDGLNSIERVRVYGVPPTSPRTPTIAFTVEGHTSESVARQLADEAVFVSHGDFYASTLVRQLGLGGDGLVRAGCACYTTMEEVERLLDGVARIARRTPSVP